MTDDDIRPVRSRPGSSRYPDPPPPVPARLRFVGIYFSAVGGIVTLGATYAVGSQLLAPLWSDGASYAGLETKLLTLGFAICFLWSGRLMYEGQRLGGVMLLGLFLPLAVSQLLGTEKLVASSVIFTGAILAAILTAWRRLE